jgi:hypothetical protein
MSSWKLGATESSYSNVVGVLLLGEVDTLLQLKKGLKELNESTEPMVLTVIKRIISLKMKCEWSVDFLNIDIYCREPLMLCFRP